MAPVYREDYPFMTCILKVEGSSGLKTVSKVLGKCQGVNSFQMDDNGLVEVSGTVDPESLLKVLGKAGNKAEMVWFQFGRCSNNLFMRTKNGSNGRYLHSGNVARPTSPSYDDAIGYYNGRNDDYRLTYNGHSHDYQLANYHNSYYDQSYGHEQGYYGHGHGYYGYGYGY